MTSCKSSLSTQTGHGLNAELNGNREMSVEKIIETVIVFFLPLLMSLPACILTWINRDVL